MVLNMIAQVAVDIVYSADIPYSYRVPAFLEDSVSEGDMVKVPFGRGDKPVLALVLSVSREEPSGRLKEIREKTSVSLSGREMALVRFLKNRCFCSVFEALRLVRPDQGNQDSAPLYERVIEITGSGNLPEGKQYEKQRKVLAFLKKNGPSPLAFLLFETGVSRSVVGTLEKNGFVRTVMRCQSRSPVVLRKDIRRGNLQNELNDEQLRAFDEISAGFGSGKTHLLYGVTGSGKTHVFIALIDRVLSEGKSVIVLIPEISLTYQLVERLYAHYGNLIAILHSGLSKGEKSDERRRIESGEARVVVGTRSAVFAPVKNLGLIIMDEEQEHTYKSEMTPRYHAREVAAFLAAREKALLLLASATPSFESYLRASEGIIGFSKITTRFNRQPLPKVVTVDLQREVRMGNRSVISRSLASEIEQNLKNGEQTILFMNRRGYNSYVACPACGTVLKCPNCGIPLTYHLDSDRLMCHYCSYSDSVSGECPGCGAKTMRYTGVGTQKAEEELKKAFPELRILRMDADTVTGKNSRDEMLSGFSRHEYDLLLGTQMITKGLDFPDVTLVGVLNADSLLYSSDFRAYERTFSLLTQVTGRAGRSEKSGRAVIQTYSPAHEVLRFAFEQDYVGFFENQLPLRKSLLYPPYCDLCQGVFIAQNELSALAAAEEYISILKKLIGGKYGKIGVKVIMPRITAVPMVDGKSRSRILIKCRDNAATREMLNTAYLEFLKDKRNKNVVITLDMNPMSIL